MAEAEQILLLLWFMIIDCLAQHYSFQPYRALQRKPDKILLEIISNPSHRM